MVNILVIHSQSEGNVHGIGTTYHHIFATVMELSDYIFLYPLNEVKFKQSVYCILNWTNLFLKEGDGGWGTYAKDHNIVEEGVKNKSFLNNASLT